MGLSWNSTKVVMNYTQHCVCDTGAATQATQRHCLIFHIRPEPVIPGGCWAEGLHMGRTEDRGE